MSVSSYLRRDDPAHVAPPEAVELGRVHVAGQVRVLVVGAVVRRPPEHALLRARHGEEREDELHRPARCGRCGARSSGGSPPSPRTCARSRAPPRGGAPSTTSPAAATPTTAARWTRKKGRDRGETPRSSRVLAASVMGTTLAARTSRAGHDTHTSPPSSPHVRQRTPRPPPRERPAGRRAGRRTDVVRAPTFRRRRAAPQRERVATREAAPRRATRRPASMRGRPPGRFTPCPGEGRLPGASKKNGAASVLVIDIGRGTRAGERHRRPLDPCRRA